jgi:hypothetical protein
MNLPLQIPVLFDNAKNIADRTCTKVNPDMLLQHLSRKVGDRRRSKPADSCIAIDDLENWVRQYDSIFNTSHWKIQKNRRISEEENSGLVEYLLNH